MDRQRDRNRLGWIDSKRDGRKVGEEWKERRDEVTCSQGKQRHRS